MKPSVAHDAFVLHEGKVLAQGPARECQRPRRGPMSSAVTPPQDKPRASCRRGCSTNRKSSTRSRKAAAFAWCLRDASAQWPSDTGADAGPLRASKTAS